MTVETDVVKALESLIEAGNGYRTQYGNCGAPIQQAAADQFKIAMDKARAALEAYRKPDNWASDAEISSARDAYQTDDIEIDDHEVKRSEGDGGVWVAAWVWLASEDEACPSCGETAQDGTGTCITCGHDLEGED